MNYQDRAREIVDSYCPDEAVDPALINAKMLIEDIATALETAEREGYERGAKENKTADAYFERLKKKSFNEAIEKVAKFVDSMKNGFTVEVTEGILMRDKDGPWFLKYDIAKAIRNLSSPQVGHD